MAVVAMTNAIRVHIPLAELGPLEHDATTGALACNLGDVPAVIEGLKATAKELGREFNGMPVDPTDVHR